MIAAAPKRFALLTAIAALVAAGCGASRPAVQPADDLYASARQFHEEGLHEAAVDHYKLLLENYPLDPRSQEVELAMAQAHYAAEAYPEAIAAFSDFQRMHPTSPQLPEVEYSIGQAYMDQMSTVDRDLANAANATARFESVAQRFPRSEYADKAREKLRATRDHLAARELYVAEFYYGRGKTRAARGRILELLVKYPDSDSARGALQRLAEDAGSKDDPELVALAEAALAEHPAVEREGAAPAPAVVVAKPGPSTASVIDALRTRQGRPAVTGSSGSPAPQL